MQELTEEQSAICYQCGDFKPSAWVPCENCGALPTSDEDMALSLALTDRYFGKPTLAQFRRIIQGGQRPHLDAESLDQLAIEVRQAKDFDELPSSIFEKRPVLEFQIPVWKLWLRRHANFTLIELFLSFLATLLACAHGYATQRIAGINAGRLTGNVNDWAGRADLFLLAAAIVWIVAAFLLPILALALPRQMGSRRWFAAAAVLGAVTPPLAFWLTRVPVQ